MAFRQRRYGLGPDRNAAGHDDANARACPVLRRARQDQEPAFGHEPGDGRRRGGDPGLGRLGLQPRLFRKRQLVGDLAKAGLVGIDGDSAWALPTPRKAIPELLFACFQMSFAAITVALVVGALVERVRFSAMLLFTVLFVTIVYAPIAHMVWAADGLIFQTGAIDFAGGTVVHINAGIAGLVGVAFAGPRIGFLKEAMPPHSLALVLVGAGLLWVGWFGFNAGSALEANGLAAIAMLNTFVAPAAGLLGWMGIERWRSGKPSLLGGASGAVAGLVAVTPAAGVSGPLGAMLLGAGGQRGLLRLHRRWPSIGCGSTTALTCSASMASAGSSGRSARRSSRCPRSAGMAATDYALGAQLGRQLGAVLLAIGWSAAGSAICFALARLAVPLRRDADEEREGLDLSDHGERAYNP